MIRHDYVLLALAFVLLATNCLGAGFTIKKTYFTSRAQQTENEGLSAGIKSGWTGIYGRLAVAQGISVVAVLGAAAIIFSHQIVEFLRSLF